MVTLNGRLQSAAVAASAIYEMIDAFQCDAPRPPARARSSAGTGRKAKGPTPTMKSRDGTEATDALSMMNVGNHGNFHIVLLWVGIRGRRKSAILL